MQNIIKSFDFFTGGKAVFTVSNPTGEHYTYKILKPDSASPFFVSLLAGPNNTEDFTYIGVFMPQMATLKMTRASEMNENSMPVKVFKWAVQQLFLKKEIPEGYRIQHEGLCCRCGRALTVPESIDDGIGPECKKILTETP